MARKPFLRPSDADAIRSELRQVATGGTVPLLFGGEVYNGTLMLSQFIGARTGSLRGVRVRPFEGLGGASMAAGRPMSVADYGSASTITHEFDVPVLAEGIKSILAVPVLVGGKPRAVLYGAYRTSAPVGGRAAQVLVNSARALSSELHVRDEVDRRLRMTEGHQANTGERTVGTEQIREVYAELRRLASGPHRSVTGAELRLLADQLSEALSGESAGVAEDAVSLSPRELDVLAQIALGSTNQEVAQRLSIRPETVKSYLRSAAAKLGAHSRYEVVSKARLARLLP